jgi:outer membrane immunogenic protein
MKKLLLGSVALAAMLAGPAMAADMPYKAPPPAPPVVYYDWSGAYVGFNVGGIWSTINQDFPNPLLFGGTGPGSGNNFSTSPNDGIYGFHAGAQWQWGAWVLGVEAALSGCFNECRAESGIVPPPGIAPNTFFEHKITNLFTVGPRLGYAWDRWMIFATGGWASANLKSAACNSVANTCDGPGTRFNGQSRNSGWYAGGGFDYMVHKGALVDVILGVEYQHFDVGGERAFCFNPACNGPTGWDEDLSAKGDIVRARLTIKTQGYGYLWGTAAPAYGASGY